MSASPKRRFFLEKKMLNTERHKIIVYDTTLRDGAQTPGVSLTVENKLRIAQELDKIGFVYMEGGWPDSNPTDIEFFSQAKKLKLKNSKLIAFGMTIKVDELAENSSTLKALLNSETEIVTIFGKSWTLHVKFALRTTLKNNLNMIYNSVNYLAKQRRVFYDAEHFFDGFRDNPNYALKTLQAAKLGGAEVVVLCDTNGGSTPEFIFETTKKVKSELGEDFPLGIHVHNDGGLGLASTLAAVAAGVNQVQGTINGVGERCGNLDLCQFLPTAQFKYFIDIGDIDLTKIIELSRFVELENGFLVSPNIPYVGENAFRHKAGVHVSAVRRHTSAYSHIIPSLVGGEISFNHSDQGGGANVLAMAEKHGIDLSVEDQDYKELVRLMKNLKDLGDAQEFLLLYRTIKKNREPFDVLDESEVRTKRGSTPKAEIKVKVNGDILQESAFGNGPIHAFDLALRKALIIKYPQVSEVKLIHFKVPETNQVGTNAQVLIYTEFGADGKRWTSLARGTNIQEAGENAIIEGYKYFILKEVKGN